MDSFTIIHDLGKTYTIPTLNLANYRLGRKVYNELCGSIVDMLMSDLNILNYNTIIDARNKIKDMLE